MRCILFRVMEPMMFRGASEFSPASRGPQTGAWSKPLPPPSTITGALATLILQHENRTPKVRQPSAWYEEVTDCLGGKGSTMLRGPYLIDGKNSVYVQYKNGLLPLNGLSEGLKKGDLLEATKDLDKKMKKFEPGYVDLIGIKLSDDGKVAETGMIYSVRMIDYAKIGEQRDEGCRIMIEVFKPSDSLEKALKAPKIIRLGGEGRLVEVMAEELQPVREFVEKEDLRTSRLKLYVATPLLFEASPSLTSRQSRDEAGTVSLSSSLKLEIERLLTGVGLMVTSIRVAGSLGIVGGFSLAQPSRKPIYAALQPGSVIEVSSYSPLSQEMYSKVYSEGLGLFRDLGYGTIIPIPVADHV